MFKSIFIFLITLITINTTIKSYASVSQEFSVIPVGEANIAKEKIVFFPPSMDSQIQGKNLEERVKEAYEIIKNDFAFYHHLLENYQLSSSQITDVKDWSKTEFNESDFSFWKDEEITFAVQIRASFSKAKNDLEFLVNVYNILDKKKILTTEKLIQKEEIRRDSHRLANQIYKSIKNKESIFLTKIFFVSDKESTKTKKIKELYEMDFDGFNKKRVTFHDAFVISPSVSPDNKRLVYSLIDTSKPKRNINLHLMNLDSNKSEPVSTLSGINSGAIFSKTDNEIILTLSNGGYPNLFALNLDDKNLRRITKNTGIDVDPSLSEDGSILTFLSNRPGKAMIYTLDPKGTEKNVRRISFVGKYNATPRFSPIGHEIVFASWLDDAFDLFRIDASGKNLVRLTKDFGSNEDPVYSNDGEFIAFTSQEVINQGEAKQNIFIMNRMGQIIGQVTNNFGHAISPRWSNPLN